MQDSNAPTKIQVPWGTGAGSSFIRQVPVPSQIGITNGAASWTDGFPPLNLTKISAGGVPPFGQDMNGALNQISSGLQWVQAGGAPFYDPTFQAAVGGYPNGAIVTSNNYVGLQYLSLVDNNLSNPDANGAGWIIFGNAPLSTNLNLYVSTSGSDSNNGLSPATPFATINRAINLAISFSGRIASIVINIANGTYTTPITIIGNNGGNLSQIAFVGNPSSPDSCIINVTNANCFTIFYGAVVTINGFKLLASGPPLSITNTQGCGILAGGGATVILNNIDFNSCTNTHLYSSAGSQISMGGTGQYTISNSSNYHLIADSLGIIDISGGTVNITGTPNFSTFFAQSAKNALIGTLSTTINGSATGVRYNAEANGTIFTPGRGPSFFPGSVAGITSFGGQYV